MVNHAREDSVQVAGSRMGYVCFGKGEKDLVIIPGLSLRSIQGTAIPLAYSFRQFARDFRVHVFDRKDGLPEVCTVAGFADDVAEAMGKLGIVSADMLGVSQGGMIAQYLAIRHPHLVRKLVLAVTASRVNDTLESAVTCWVGHASRGDYQAIAKDMMTRMYSPQYARRYGWLFPLALRAVKVNGPERFVKLAKACLTCDCYDSLDQIRCPAYVIGGRLDRIVTAQASVEIAVRLNRPLYLYDDLGHSAYEEAKDFNDRVYRFLTE